MKILVALKQVPDTESKIKIDGSGCQIDQADLKWITSPNDEYALEEAIRLKEGKGAEVTAVTMGGEKSKDVLRNALALGADGAVLLKGEPMDDPLAIANSLASFAKGKGFDLLLFGHKCYGNDNGSVGQMTAEILGLSHAHGVTKLEIADSGFRAEKEGDAGLEVIEGSLPAVVTAQRGLNEPRYASLKGIMAAKKKPIEEADCPQAGPAIKISALSPPPARAAGKRIEGGPAEQAAALTALLRDEAKII
jgi:electron transfer flavoprotein beta subunit